MKAITIDNIIYTYASIEAYWKDKYKKFFLRPDTIFYHTLPAEEHYKDGWRDVVQPVIGANQKRGNTIYFDQANDRYTYNVLDLTEEEIRSLAEQQVAAKQSELIEAKKTEQALNAFQAITDQKEALAVKEVYPAWTTEEDYLKKTAGYKVTRTLKGTEGYEVRLFSLITPHVPQAGWEPENTPALWSEIKKEGDQEVWTQPTAGDGRYPYLNPATGQPYELSHKSETWRNRRQSLNTWEPGTPSSGWMQVSNLPAPWYYLGAEGYPLNWETTHKGSTWINNSANNFYEPGVFGWTVKT